MKKLRLELDDLAVESFSTSREGREERGTVQGHLRASPSYGWDCKLSWDVRCFTNELECYTQNGGDSCQVYYTCPECAAPTYDLLECPVDPA